MYSTIFAFSRTQIWSKSMMVPRRWAQILCESCVNVELTLVSMNNLASTHSNMGDSAAALLLHQGDLESSRRTGTASGGARSHKL